MSAKPRLSLNFIDTPFQVENYFVRLLEKKYELVREDTPEFLIFTHIGHRHRLYNCIKIYYSQEIYPPDWGQCDYTIHSCWFPGARALHLPIFAFGRSPAPLEGPRGGDHPTRRRFCVFLAGYDDRSVRNRRQFLKALGRYRKVDSFGKALNNTGIKAEDGYYPKIHLLSGYKFHIAFENKERPGWCTEKLYDALAAGTVPIYWGDPRVEDYFNPQAFINARNFRSWDSLAEYIAHVDQNDDLYGKYLAAHPFPSREPPPVFREERVLAFFEKIFTSHEKPVSQRRWFFPLTKWRLVKRNKLPGE